MRKRLLERAKAIFSYLDERKTPVYKSELKAIGLDPVSAENWIRLIQFIQSQPELISDRAGRYTTIRLANLESK